MCTVDKMYGKVKSTFENATLLVNVTKILFNSHISKIIPAYEVEITSSSFFVLFVLRKAIDNQPKADDSQLP